MGVFTPIVNKGPFRPGGAPHITTSSTHRPYENGLAERKHRSLKERAATLMASAGFGWKGYAFAYAQAARIENLLTTTIPVPRTRDTTRGVPLEKRVSVTTPRRDASTRSEP